jgi:hypothetical protein
MTPPLLWFIMVYYGLLWFIMVYYGLLWFIMVYYGLLWFIMVRCLHFKHDKNSLYK